MNTLIVLRFRIWFCISQSNYICNVTTTILQYYLVLLLTFFQINILYSHIVDIMLEVSVLAKINDMFDNFVTVIALYYVFIVMILNQVHHLSHCNYMFLITKTYPLL
jgi:hypothetical protein